MTAPGWPTACRYLGVHDAADEIADLSQLLEDAGVPPPYVLVGHSLAVGPGVNPLGDEALAALPDWSAAGPCVPGSTP